MNKEELLQDGYRLTAISNVRKSGLYLLGKFMHGDADAYTEEEMPIESLAELVALGKYFDWRNQMPHNAEISDRQRGMSEEKFYELVGREWKEDYLWDGLIDWWPRDVTSGGDIHASLEKTWLIYSDGQHEWRVEK
jgi:hypothetical protein